MFGSALRAFREGLGLKQTQLAVAAGIRPHTLWRHEAGHYRPNVVTMEKLANAMARLSQQPITVGDLIALIPENEKSRAAHGPTLHARISKSKRGRKAGKAKGRQRGAA
jgi:DNA-binding XRE family transcriptional regulator